MARELKNLLIHRLHDRALLEHARAHFHGVLLDIGCGTKPYRDMLAPFVTAHIGIEHQRTPHGMGSVDVVGTAYSTAIRDCAADSAMCTAVLEHLEDPTLAVRECFRVLRPGGVAIYSVPFIWHLHEQPRDFYRFTPHGLRHVFEQAGFVVIDIVPLSGFWVTFGQELIYYLDRHNRGLLRRSRVFDLAAYAIQAAAELLDRIDRAPEWSWMHMAVVRKPEQARE